MNRYPEGLLDWSGDKAGGVKKLFYTMSGRPSGEVIKTRLLDRLSLWAQNISNATIGTPRAIFLIGGPGNGKTEAIEHTIRALDTAMQLDGSLVSEFASKYSRKGLPDRLIVANETNFPVTSNIFEIEIVQDGSEGEKNSRASPAAHLCNDIRGLLERRHGVVYMACVNRGVLDDALISAIEQGDLKVAELLKQMVQSASLGAKSRDCWPMESYPDFAIWPMDVESLVDEISEDTFSAARQIIDAATRSDEWPAHESCNAGVHCPFCTNRKLLTIETHVSSYIRILRWYELASGKRWNFRDLFSLTAFLLAGTTDTSSSESYSPCNWAASQLTPQEKDSSKAKIKKVRGLFKLVAAQYQHALFGEWPTEKSGALKSDIKELQLESEPALMGLLQFLAQDKRKESTTTLRTQLAGMSVYLDPAFASPNLVVAVSDSTSIKFEELDRRFSLSIKEARIYLQRFKCLSRLELDLLIELEEADIKLSDESIRRRKSAVAERVQAFIRLIACRIARRSIGARSGITKDADVLVEFNQVLKGNVAALQEASKQVEGLLNKDRDFLVSLNTTFGESLPPPERRAMLTTEKQKVRAVTIHADTNRPRSPLRFLSIGSMGMDQSVALTYELFKATKSLQKGIVPASLPRSVVALLDITRAKLAGSVVRNEEVLEGSEIRLGIRDDVIVRNFGKFIVHREKGQ